MKSSAPDRKTADKVIDQPPTPRVCLLTESFHPVVGGAETHARLLARHLNALGMSTFVLTRRSDPKLSHVESVNGIRVSRVPPARMKRFGKYAMVPFAFAELVRKRKSYDIIFVCGLRVLGAPAVMAAKVLGKTCVLRAEALGEMTGHYASVFGRLPLPVELLFRACICARNGVLKYADGFVGISGPVAREFAQCGAAPERIFGLPNGIDTELFRPVDEVAKRLLRERLGLPIRAEIASYSGKLNRGKGLEHLIRAWEIVRHERASAHLALIGSGGGMSLSCEDELRRFVRERRMSSTVTFTGYVENVHEYLQASDLFVFPSEDEAFGLSLVEAMSCGLPVIASRVGGIPEIVEHSHNGILVRPGDPHALAREVIRLLGRPMLVRSLASHARRTVCERYSIEAVAARYHQLFCALHAGKCKFGVEHAEEVNQEPS